MAHFGANSVVHFNRKVRLFTARTTTVTVYCWRLTGSSYWGGAVTPPQKILGLFYFFTWNGSFWCKFSCILTEALGNLLLRPRQYCVLLALCGFEPVDPLATGLSIFGFFLFWLCPLSSWPSAQTKHHKICDMVSKFRVSWILWPRIRGLLAQSGALKSSQIKFIFSIAE